MISAKYSTIIPKSSMAQVGGAWAEGGNCLVKGYTILMAHFRAQFLRVHSAAVTVSILNNEHMNDLT